MIELISCSVLLMGFTLFFYFILVQRSRKIKMANRVDDLIKDIDLKEDGVEKKVRFSKRVISNVSKIFVNMQLSEKTKKKLEQAGSDLKLEEFIVIQLASALGTGLLFYVVGVPIGFCLVITLLGYLIPSIYMKKRVEKRLNLLSFQLVEALGTMSNSLRAGFSFIQTIQLIGKEMPDPIGPEFNRVVRELKLGVSLEVVFHNMLSRLPNKELEVVCQAILAQRKSGGNLAELLETMEETIRGRIRILEELKTLTAQGKLSSWIITFLPIGVGFYLYFASPDYFRPMVETPIGWLMLSGGVISLGIGWLLVQKIVRIEV